MENTELESGAVLAGRYRVESVLGKGGMARVYAAEHIHTGERVAVKVLHGAVASDAAAVARFRHEARVFAQVKSSALVRIIDADVSVELGGLPFLVMELLEGRDLAEVLRGEGPQPPQRVVEWIRQLAAGLARAHEMGIVHRDLKPANLMLVRGAEGEETLKILDFGAAKLISESDGPTRTGVLLGTPRYMAPEQAQLLKEGIGPATDQWAIGLITFALLTGRHYFLRGTTEELIATILFAPLVAPSQYGLPLGQAFDDWFLRSCAREPKRRWPGVLEQAEALAAALDGVSVPVLVEPREELPMSALETVVDGGTVSATQRSHSLPSLRPAHASRRPLWVGSVLLLAGVLGAAWWKGSGSGAEAPPPEQPMAASTPTVAEERPAEPERRGGAAPTSELPLGGAAAAASAAAASAAAASAAAASAAAASAAAASDRVGASAAPPSARPGRPGKAPPRKSTRAEGPYDQQH